MPTSYLTRVVEFTATHRLSGADFGKAAEDHSHRYRCRVTVKGALRATQGGRKAAGASTSARPSSVATI